MSLLAVTAAGVGLLGAGQILGGISAGNSAHYQSQVATNNQTIAKQNENYAASAESAQVERAGLKERQQGAAVRAGLASSGVDVNSGSAADTQVSQREIGNLDTQTVKNNAALKVYGYQTQAANFGAQSQLEESQVGPDILGGVLSGAGSIASHASLLSHAPSVPPEYSWMQNSAPEEDGG